MKKKIFIKPQLETLPMVSEAILAGSDPLNPGVGGSGTGTNEQNAKAAFGEFSLDF